MSNLTETVIGRLSENKFSDALEVLCDPKNEVGLKKCCWDLIPILFKNVSGEMLHQNSELKTCSENLLEIVASKAEAEEVVLEFLDQLESADSIKFCVVMKLLGICLPRCTQKRHLLIESCLISLRSFLDDFIPTPPDYISEEEYEEDLCSKLGEVTTVLNALLDFFQIFVEQVLGKSQDYESKEIVNILLSRLIQLYDFFLPCGNRNEFKPLEEVESRVMRLTNMLVNNPFHFLQFLLSRWIKAQSKITKTKEFHFKNEDLRNICDDIELNGSLECIPVYENDRVISDLAYAVFFHSILKAEKEGHDIKIPQVYNPKYVFLSLANLSNPFFEKNFNKTIVKGLNFLENLLHFTSNMPLERYDLFFMFHEKILINLNTIMVYSDVESSRKLALNCFKKYIEIFDYEGRYFLLINIRPMTDHAGTLGFLITLLKQYILDTLSNDTLKSYSKFYSGMNLFELIKIYCFLRNGENTDLVQHADQVISSLNLLRFLLIRDKENKTEIQNYVYRINNEYLKPLTNAVTSCKEFYQVKLQEFGKELTKSDNNIELTINGQPLAHLTNGEKQSALFASLNAVDLIDSLLQRVLECINTDVRRLWKSCSVGRILLVSSRNFTTQNESKPPNEDTVYEDSIKEKILESSLPFVNKRGWSAAAISDGAVSLGYPGVINGVFPNPSAELINHFNRKCNRELCQNMIDVVNGSESSPNPQKFIENAVQFRLKMLIPYIEKWAQALAIMSIPTNIPIAAETFSSLIDDICYYSGDKSVDLNWYCRRGAVSLIYKSTELCMLQDKSQDFVETWKFLERRTDEAFKVDKILQTNENFVGTMREFSVATLTTLGNILRINRR